MLEIALILVGVWAAWVGYEINKPGGCAGECYQGRRPCNCKQEPEPVDENWPFPTNKKP